MKQSRPVALYRLLSLCALLHAEAACAAAEMPGNSYFVKATTQIRSDFWQPANDGATRHDTFIRRARLSLGWNQDIFGGYLEMAADNTDRAPNNRVTSNSSLDDGEGSARLSQAFAELRGGEWKLRVGKSKLPLTRVYLVSSSEQLFWDRPQYTEYLRSFFRRFVDSNIQAHYFADNRHFAAYAAVSDGWNSGDEIYPGVHIESSSPMYASRLEFSPTAELEKKKKDARGGEPVTAISAYCASQSSIRTSAFSEQRQVAGIDAVVRLRDGLALMSEWNHWSIDGGPAPVTGRGWYVQGTWAGLTLEPAVRFEALRLDSRPQGETALRSTSIGVNYYLAGRDIKLGINLQHNTGSAIRDTLYPRTLLTVGLQAGINLINSH